MLAPCLLTNDWRCSLQWFTSVRPLRIGKNYIKVELEQVVGGDKYSNEGQGHSGPSTKFCGYLMSILAVFVVVLMKISPIFWEWISLPDVARVPWKWIRIHVFFIVTLQPKWPLVTKYFCHLLAHFCHWLVVDDKNGASLGLSLIDRHRFMGLTRWNFLSLI